jgi:hypothetical protein
MESASALNPQYGPLGLALFTDPLNPKKTMNNSTKKRKQGKTENKIPNQKLAWPCSQKAKK